MRVNSKSRSMLRRANTMAATTHSIGGREKKGAARSKPVTLPALARIEAKERERGK